MTETLFSPNNPDQTFLYSQEFLHSDQEELEQRIREVIVYGNLKVVTFEWTREAYTDLTSMGREYTEPAKNDDQLPTYECYRIVKGNHGDNHCVQSGKRQY